MKFDFLSHLFTVPLEGTPISDLDGEGFAIEASVFPWPDLHPSNPVPNWAPIPTLPCHVNASFSQLWGLEDPHFLGSQSSTGTLDLNDEVDRFPMTGSQIEFVFK